MPKTTSAGFEAGHGQLAEVWGDVISRPQLGKAIIIGAVVSLAVYLAAMELIVPIASTPAVGKALAMLAGILGSILSGAICARLFPPKRTLLEQVPANATWQTEILLQLEQDGGPIGRIADLPEVVKNEMREVGLFDLFHDYEQSKTIERKGE